MTRTPNTALTLVLISAAALALSESKSWSANIYNTNFDSLDRTLALSQQDGWTTNDPYNVANNAGQSDVLRIVGGYSQDLNDNWAILGGQGGFEPNNFNITVAKPISTGGILTGAADANILQFGVSFGVASSAIPRPDLDTFGWTFNTAVGNQLFRLALVPNSTNSADGMRVKWYDGANVETSTPIVLSYNSIYNLSVSLGMENGTRDSVGVVVQDGFGAFTTVLRNITIPDGTTQSVGQVGATWAIKNPATNGNGTPASYGSNAVIFDQVNVAAVPEPTAALLLLGGAAFGALSRRRKQ